MTVNSSGGDIAADCEGEDDAEGEVTGNADEDGNGVPVGVGSEDAGL